MMKNDSSLQNRCTPSRKNSRKRTKCFDPSIAIKKKKLDNDVSNEPHQISIIRKHLIKTSEKDMTKAMDQMCSELGLHNYVSEDDLSDDPDHGFREIPKTSVEQCINKIFEGLDDYAAFNPKIIGTPIENRKVFSTLNTSICSPSVTPLPRRSILKSCSTKSLPSLRNVTINETPTSSRSSVIITSFNNKSNSKIEGERTPLEDRTNLFKTPTSFIDTSIGNVSIPITPNNENALRDSLSTPTGLTPSIVSKKSLSPVVVDVSPEVKKTLLKGISCYVDVKTNKEDCSSSVALELSSMGAVVQKTFNKKVNYVIFKEGKPSTYFKAKSLGITMVCVLWIEACKKARKMVDPLSYPPVNIDKYESLSPNAKRIPSLKTIQRKLRKHILRDAGVSVDNKDKIRINWRRALTDIKLQRNSSQDSSEGRQCMKKLDFFKEDVIGSQKSIITVSDGPDDESGDKKDIVKSSSEDSCNFSQISSQNVRRNSAPAICLHEKKKRKKKDDPPAESQNRLLTLDQMFAKMVQNKKDDNENKENSQCSQVSRKKKLLNPNDIISIDSTPDEKSAPPVINYEFPYKDEEDTAARKKLKTRSTSVRKVFKRMVVKKSQAKKSLTSLLEQDETNSSKSSLSLFVSYKKSKPPKDPPTIVCTSLLPEEVRKVAYITGKLGVFDLEDKVSLKTTHLVTSAPRRTINLLKALVRGAWILHVDWLYKSEEAGHWLNEEEFELKNFSHAVTEMRRERQAFGPEFCSELFYKCGTFYVSRRSVPPQSDLTELVRLCKGKLVSNPKQADFIIGGKPLDGETTQRLKEKWILDCITQNTLLDMNRYYIKAKI